MARDAEWSKRASDLLVGRKIVTARYMTAEEAAVFGWGRRPVVLVLDNGLELIPQADDEGNDGGALLTSDQKCQLLPLL